MVLKLRIDDIYPEGHGIDTSQGHEVVGRDLPVKMTEPLGNETLLLVGVGGAECTSLMLNPRHIASGEVLPFRLDLAKAHVFDAATGVSLRTL